MPRVSQEKCSLKSGKLPVYIKSKEFQCDITPFIKLYVIGLFLVEKIIINLFDLNKLSLLLAIPKGIQPIANFVCVFYCDTVFPEDH